MPDLRMKRDLVAFSSSALSPASVHFCSLNTLSSTDITIRMVRWLEDSYFLARLI
jgi:hypothetical protein